MILASRILRKRLARLGLVLLPGLALTLAAREEAPETTRFWDTDFVHVIHLRVTPKQWQLLQPTKQGMLQRVTASLMTPPTASPTNLPVLPPGATKSNAPRHEGDRLEPNFYGFEFAYVKAGVECDGAKLADAGLKLRGNSSYNWGVSAGHKRPLKIAFNRFVAGQKLHGIASFHLNNNAYDPSFLREALGYELFRQLGVPAPRTTFALLYLTIDGEVREEFLGLYLVLEEIDSPAFLKHHFDSAKGLLLKPWSIAGLPYFGEQWPAYEARYNTRTEINDRTARRTIDFLKLVNYAADATFRARIGQYLDVEEFLRFLAGQVILVNLDSILLTGHNFYLYLDPDDDRFRFLPWDLNLAFANNYQFEPQQAVQLSLLHPHTGEAKLVDRLLAIPQYKEKYLAIIQQCLARDFNSEKLLPRLDALQSVLARADQAADAAWAVRWAGKTNAPARPVPKLTGWGGKPAIPLKDFVTQRVAAIRAQLSGETEGFRPIRRAPPALPGGGARAPSFLGPLPTLAQSVMRAANSHADAQLTRAQATNAIRQFFLAATTDAPNQDSLDQTNLSLALTRSLPGFFRSARSYPPAQAWATAILTAADPQKTNRATLGQLWAAADAAFTAADPDKTGRLDEVELLTLINSLGQLVPPEPAKAKSPYKKSRSR